jgi:hypothetical protein
LKSEVRALFHASIVTPVSDVEKRVVFATARERNEISGSDVADVSCKLIVTV